MRHLEHMSAYKGVFSHQCQWEVPLSHTGFPVSLKDFIESIKIPLFLIMSIQDWDVPAVYWKNNILHLIQPHKSETEVQRRQEIL